MTLVRNISVSTPFYVVSFATNLSIEASTSPLAWHTGVDYPALGLGLHPASLHRSRARATDQQAEVVIAQAYSGSGDYLNEDNFMLRT